MGYCRGVCRTRGARTIGQAHGTRSKLDQQHEHGQHPQAAVAAQSGQQWRGVRRHPLMLSGAHAVTQSHAVI
jgi:hypothetical protein